MNIAIISLGCPKNQVDADVFCHALIKAGHQTVADPEQADIIIVNTCGFIESAKTDSIDTILDMAQYKTAGSCKLLVVTGCLSQRYGDELARELPEVDVFNGVKNYPALAERLAEICGVEPAPESANAAACCGIPKRLLTTPSYRAYLRIADGCDNRCTYCAIPLIRGGRVSTPMETLLAEAEQLAESGVTELTVIAQDTSAYGIDLYKKYALPDLLKQLCKIDGIKWIRLLYCYPERMTDELIETIKTEDKVLNYIDIPIQHCNKEILRNMYRGGDEQSLRELFAKLRREIPGVVLRTTLITGFPGETEEQFSELAEFVNDIKFERLGCFAYSAEEDTPAAEMPDQVDEGERQRRADIITSEQEIRMGEYYAGMVGNTYEVVCEGFDRYSDMYFGRSMHFAPEIDGMIYFTSAKDKGSLTIGDFVNVKITDVLENNLLGERV